MSTDPYTPETIDVKVAYCTSFDPGFAHKVMAHTVAEMTTGHAGDFDRWLEKHDREVRASAALDIVELGDADYEAAKADPATHGSPSYREGFLDGHDRAGQIAEQYAARMAKPGEPTDG